MTFDAFDGDGFLSLISVSFFVLCIASFYRKISSVCKLTERASILTVQSLFFHLPSEGFTRAGRRIVLRKEQ